MEFCTFYGLALISGTVALFFRANGALAAIFAITPDEGYEISAVLVDGVDVGAVSEYTFKKVRAAHTISAIFTKID